MTTQPSEAPRTRLTRDRILQGAVQLADAQGIAAVTMRNLAAELGAEAMSLYYHVANKEALLDGMVDLVVAEINQAVNAVDPPARPDDWRRAMRERILTARAVLLRHRWAPGVIETRTSICPQVMLYFDGLLEILRAGGFSYDLAHHAMHALGSRALGFTQELFDPDDQGGGEEQTNAALEAMAAQTPYLVEMLSEIAHDDPDSTLGWCDDQTEFEFGLDLLLDGLDRMRDSS